MILSEKLELSVEHYPDSNFRGKEINIPADETYVTLRSTIGDSLDINISDMANVGRDLTLEDPDKRQLERKIKWLGSLAGQVKGPTDNEQISFFAQVLSTDQRPIEELAPEQQLEEVAQQIGVYSKLVIARPYYELAHDLRGSMDIADTQQLKSPRFYTVIDGTGQIRNLFEVDPPSSETTQEENPLRYPNESYDWIREFPVDYQYKKDWLQHRWLDTFRKLYESLDELAIESMGIEHLEAIEQ